MLGTFNKTRTNTIMALITSMVTSHVYADRIALHMDTISKDDAMLISFSDVKVAEKGKGREGCEGQYKVLVEYIARWNTQPIFYADGCWQVMPDNTIPLVLQSAEDGETFIKIYTVEQVSKEPINKNVNWSNYIINTGRPDEKIQDQIKYIEQLNDKCRGGSGDDPATMQACDMREKAGEQLKKQGWCWGPDDAIGADKHWIHCRPSVSDITGPSSQTPSTKYGDYVIDERLDSKVWYAITPKDAVCPTINETMKSSNLPTTRQNMTPEDVVAVWRSGGRSAIIDTSTMPNVTIIRFDNTETAYTTDKSKCESLTVIVKNNYSQ